MRRIWTLTPYAKAAVLANEWAREIGLPAGTLWEPGIVRSILREWERVGMDASAREDVTAAIRSGLGLDDA